MKLFPSTAGTHRDRDLGSREVNISVLRSWLLLTGIDVRAPGWLTYLCVRSRLLFRDAWKSGHELLFKLFIAPSLFTKGKKAV